MLNSINLPSNKTSSTANQKCKYKSKEEKINAIIEAAAQLFSSYYEKFLEIFNTQFSQFIKKWQNQNDYPHHLNYLFKKIINIHRKRLDDELNSKFSDLNKKISTDKSFDEINLDKDIDYDFYLNYFNEQINNLNSTMESLLEKIKIYLDRIVANWNEKRKKFNGDEYQTDFLSDTEIEARKKNSNEIKKTKKFYSLSELDNFIVVKNLLSDESLDLNVLKSLTDEAHQEKKNPISSGLSNLKNLSTTSKSTSSKANISLGMRVFAIKDELRYIWQAGRVIRIEEKTNDNTAYCIQFENKLDIKKLNPKVNQCDEDDGEIKILPATCIALSESIDERYIIPIRSRIVTLYRNDNDRKAPYFSAGTVCEVPNPRNLNRYLIFFDDGYAQYIKKQEAFPIVDNFTMPKDLNEDHLKFVGRYFENYPQKAVVKLIKDHVLKVFYNGRWQTARVTELDCSLVKLKFEDINHSEWLYRGSYRLHPFYEKLMQEEFGKKNFINKLCDNTSSSEDSTKPYRYISPCASTSFPTAKKQTARKSSITSTASCSTDSVQSILINNVNNNNGVLKVQQGQLRQLDLQGIIRNENIMFVPHPCTASCVTQWEKNILKSKPYNLLLIPIFCGWQRHICTLSKESNSKTRKGVYYIAPCGRRLRNISEIDRFLFLTNSSLTIDMFSNDIFIHIDREFEANSRYLHITDIADGKDDIPISCVNCIDFSKPESFEYSNKRVPLENVPLITDVNLLDGCNCEDGCRDHLKCACWRKTFEATTFTGQLNTGIGYRGRRLFEMVNTGIFECNSNCRCDKRCSNRVVQNGTSVRLQLFKASVKKGWGLRCLDDIAKGAFICIYTGHVMTEEQSDIRGKELGDEYFAELDFIECLKRFRLGDNNSGSDSEEEIVTDKSNSIKTQIEKAPIVNKCENIIEYIYLNSDEEDSKCQSSSSNSNVASSSIIASSSIVASSSSACGVDIVASNLQRKRKNINYKNYSFESIYSNKFFRNPLNRFYFKDFLKNTDTYVMDAKLCGNIGRYFNHSCSPNIFVQNVFIDTYDLRFPWIAFFASQYIRAGTELCWDYNYQPNSVEGRVLYCQCGSSSCRGRLL